MMLIRTANIINSFSWNSRTGYYIEKVLPLSIDIVPHLNAVYLKVTIINFVVENFGEFKIWQILDFNPLL